MPKETPYSRLDHIGIVVKDIDKAIKHLSGLGIGPFEAPFPHPPAQEKLVRGKPVDFELKLTSARIGDVRLELLQPVKGKSVQQEFLDSHGEGLHHLGFTVKDLKSLDNEVARLSKKGVKALSSARLAQGAYAYMGTDEVGGVIIELMAKRPS